MKKRSTMFLGGCVIALGSSLITSSVMSQEGMSQDEMMAQWMELAQPGAEHKEMAKGTGEWKQQYTSWMGPGMPPEKSSGTAKMSMILDGRFLKDEVTATFAMGGEQVPFKGLGIYGFDRATKKYNFVWMDTMGTMMMHGEGTPDETGKVVTYLTEMADPAGGMVEMKLVVHEKGPDHRVTEMFMKMGDEWFKNMEIDATR